MAGFGGFDKVGAVKAKAPSKKAKDKAEVVLDGLEQVAAIDAVIKSLTALKTTLSTEVKDKMTDHFIEEGIALKRRPENFKGVDGCATASCELRARSSTSPLSVEEQELLAENAIPVETVEQTVETFIFNPEYLTDAKVMGKIEQALKGVKGLPEDIIQKQEGVSKVIVAEGALDAVFAHDEDTARELLSVVGVLAIKPKLDSDDVAKAFQIAGKLIGAVEDEASEAAARINAADAA